MLTDENRRLIEESAKILEWGVNHGLITYPLRSKDEYRHRPTNQ